MTTTPNACSDIEQSIERRNSTLIVIDVAIVTGSTVTAPTAPGSFPATNAPSPQGNVASVGRLALDPLCAYVTEKKASASSGVVTLDSIGGDIFNGHFDVTLDSGDHVTGTFAPGACPALNAPVGAINC